MRWVFVLALLTLSGLGIAFAPLTHTDREITAQAAVPIGRPVGTTGTHETAEARGANVIADIETITGTNDAMVLVGRRVDLHVDVQRRANDHAFWVGPRDNRILVVIGRDARGGSQRQRGVSAHHRIAPVRGGQRAAISGVIRRAPTAEKRWSWNLTRDDDRELADRKIYIHAEKVSSEGHGRF
jgi:hypothetical protein